MVFVATLFFVGCDQQPTQYPTNRLFVARLEKEFEIEFPNSAPAVESAVEELFGTPDLPRIPEFVASNPEWSALMDLKSIERSAGAVGRAADDVERGLYRKHCVQCHGMSGDGAGPAAYFQYPYPRDYRRGTFKFKSTVNGAKPTHEDLVRTLEHGLPGTAMPSFDLLKKSKYYSEDIEALVHYVRYLSVRGEVERKLLQKEAQGITDGEVFYDAKSSLDASTANAQRERVEKIVSDVMKSWASASSKTIGVHRPESLSFGFPKDLNSARSKELKASIARGRDLFQGPIANCSACHGKEGVGNGSAQDFDEWTKDWTIRAGIDPKEKKEWRVMKKFGAMSPRRSIPRNLQLGVYRGGSQAEDIYRRIVGGIEGTPMPPAAVQPSNAQGMTEEQLWDLVHFVMSLPEESEMPQEPSPARGEDKS